LSSSSRILVGAGNVRPASFPSFEAPSLAESRPSAASITRERAALAAEAEMLRARARAEASELGRREGRAAAYAEWSGRMGAAVESLEAAARGLLARRVELAAEVQRQLPRLLGVLIRKVLGAELSVSDTAVRTIIRHVTERLAGYDRPVTIRVNPDMLEPFQEWRRGAGADSAVPAGVRVDVDATLQPGDWLLETGDGFIDGRVESQLEEAWGCLAELPE
jgi:flagellar biosynthesis/type III secretory pathway protein FliH